MTCSSSFTYADIDWMQLWKNDRTQRSWSSKEAADWDKKAPSFAERNNQSQYNSLFLSRLPLEPSFSVLDVGSGPGTIALPLARQVHSVTAIDYSHKMLEILQHRSKNEGLNNITCVHCSWEDDWQDFNIEPADIVIASRSMNVAELSMAIDKLNDYAKRYVFISDRIAPSPFDPDVFAAIGREFNSGPDYIYTLNLLYSKAIHPHVEILQLTQDVEFSDMNEALESYIWMIKEISSAEVKKLKDFLHSHTVLSEQGRVVIRRRHPPRWALIWWKKDTSC
jgi:SAM-dependent methyltransferase